MAINTCNSKLLFSFFLIYHILLTTSSASPSIKPLTFDLIKRVCSKSPNPTLCNHVLSSDPRSARADIKGLAQISIDKAYVSGNRALAVIASLYKMATDQETKQQLQTCASTYKGAMANLNKANDALKVGGKEIFSDVTSVIDGAESCDDVYEGPPVIPPALQEANKNFEDIGYIILTIVERFS